MGGHKENPVVPGSGAADSINSTGASVLVWCF